MWKVKVKNDPEVVDRLLLHLQELTVSILVEMRQRDRMAGPTYPEVVGGEEHCFLKPQGFICYNGTHNYEPGLCSQHNTASVS